MHDYHPALPGYNATQIFHDGCAECESRSKTLDHGLRSLDEYNFARAWQRAADWNQERDVGRISDAERDLLEMIWAFQIMFERNCGIEIGRLPL